MTELFASTRTVLQPRYAVVAPDTSTYDSLPGWEKAACQVLISPGLGAGFSAVLITWERDGQCLGNTAAREYFVYLLEGSASVEIDERRHRLETGSYFFLPAGKDMQFRSGAPSTRVLVFQKPYRGLAGLAKPSPVVAHERDARNQPWRGCEEVRAQALLPENPVFDLSASRVSWPPGAAVPLVQSQFQEQGLYLLGGEGILRLANDWHPVQAGDAIWIGPYCPHWFVAVGKTPAQFICCQETRREPR